MKLYRANGWRARRTRPPCQGMRLSDYEWETELLSCCGFSSCGGRLVCARCSRGERLLAANIRFAAAAFAEVLQRC